MTHLLTQPVPLWIGMLIGSAAWLGLGLLSLAIILRLARANNVPDMVASLDAALPMPSLDMLASPVATLPPPDATTSQRLALADMEAEIELSERKGRFGP